MTYSTGLSSDTLVELICRSGLITREQIQPLLRELAEQGVVVDDGSALIEALVERGTLTHWQAEKLLEGRHRGFFLGPYRLLRLLGKGGMGSVFLAQHETMRRRCAVKVLPSKHRYDATSMLDRFYVEAQAVAAMDHPNIVRAYDLNKEAQGKTVIHYLVMEYVDGQDIQRLVQDHGLLDFVRAAEFTRQAAQGLSHAHENGLIHRDIKPANLIVNSKGIVKILDLGLAQFYESEQASLTAAHRDTVLGTADYLSPEQALDSHRIDTRSDIYSLGCSIYFMLTGRPPFPEGTVAQRLLAHQVKAPAPISTRRRDIPEDLIAIIDKMMAKKPAARFRTAREVAEILTVWLVDHAADEWKQQHPDLVRESSDVLARARAEQTRASSDPSGETELELKPLDDDESLPESTAYIAASTQTASPQAKTARRPAPQNELAAELPSLPGDPLLGAPLNIDLLSEPLGTLESSGSSHIHLDALAAPSGANSSIHGGGLGSASGPNQWVIGTGNSRRLSSTADDDSFRAVMRTIGIGLAAGIPVALLLLFLLLWSRSDSATPAGPPTPAIPSAPLDPESPDPESPDANSPDPESPDPDSSDPDSSDPESPDPDSLGADSSSADSPQS